MALQCVGRCSKTKPRRLLLLVDVGLRKGNNTHTGRSTTNVVLVTLLYFSIFEKTFELISYYIGRALGLILNFKQEEKICRYENFF